MRKGGKVPDKLIETVFGKGNRSVVVGMTWACLAALTGNIGKRGASIGHLGKSKPTINMAGLAFPAGLKGLNDELPWLHLPVMIHWYAILTANPCHFRVSELDLCWCRTKHTKVVKCMRQSAEHLHCCVASRYSVPLS